MSELRKKPTLADWWLFMLLTLGLVLWLIDQARQPVSPTPANWPHLRNSSHSP